MASKRLNQASSGTLASNLYGSILNHKQGTLCKEHRRLTGSQKLPGARAGCLTRLCHSQVFDEVRVFAVRLLAPQLINHDRPHDFRNLCPAPRAR